MQGRCLWHQSDVWSFPYGDHPHFDIDCISLLHFRARFLVHRDIFITRLKTMPGHRQLLNNGRVGDCLRRHYAHMTSHNVRINTNTNTIKIESYIANTVMILGLAPSQWETPLQSNPVSRWLGATQNQPCNVVVISGTGDCHYQNLWRQSWH